MPRKIRYIIPQIPHHVIQRGNNKQDVFHDKEDRSVFLSKLRIHSVKQKVYIGAYCLMTNHFHLLLYPDSSEGLITFMKYLSQLHTQYINKKYNRTGKLWENRYKLSMIDPGYEWVFARYIERNPLRARLVSKPEEYRYSSANFNLDGISNENVNRDIVGKRRDEYRKFFYEGEANRTKHIEDIRSIIGQEKALGCVEFINKLENKFKRSFKVRKQGRPFKNK